MVINFCMVNCLQEFVFRQFSVARIFLGIVTPPLISNGPPVSFSVHFTLGLQSEVQSLR